MIQSKSPAVFHLNELSVLLVSCALFILWMNIEFITPAQQQSNTGSVNKSKNSSNDTKYLRTLSVNPFLRSHNDNVSSDQLPTVTSLQFDVPSFSSLELKLHGVVFLRENESYAMVSVKGSIQEIVTKNTEITEGLYLTNIAKRQIEVDYFGEKHVLSVHKIRSYKGTEQLLVNKTEQKISDNFSEQINFLEVDKQRNPIRLFMIRRPYAVYRNGEFQGYKIMPGSNADQFERLGFQSGDIITYLNGVKFTGPGKKEFVIQQLTHALHIDLTVMRSGQEFTINYGF
ncbi:MAG: type II secretion system protein C [Cocleimonas sp.]|jgi:type II secretion system protein C